MRIRTRTYTELRVFALAVLICVPSLSLADFAGQVVGVIDGDLIRVMPDGKAETGIDCPEKKQPFGRRAKAIDRV